MPTSSRRRGLAAWVIALSAASCLSASALAANPWEPIATVPDAVAKLPAFVRSDIGSVVRIDWKELDASLAGVPMEGGDQGLVVALADQPTLDLPMPDGTTTTVRVVESPIMEAGLAVQFPQFRTYRVTGVTDPTLSGRFDITSFGLRGMFRSDAGTIFIDPYSAQQREYASVYYLHDYASGRPAMDFSCHVGPEHGAGNVDVQALENFTGPSDHLPQAGTFSPRGPGVQLRSYRLAMASTGEFGAFMSGVNGNPPNATDTLAAIVTVANRCNVVFETDLSVRLILIANNNLLAFFNPATDPYPDPDPVCITDPAANCSGPYLNANQTALTNIIGGANYDVGHVLTRVRGGVANLRSVCSSGSKARGVSGIPRGGELDPVSGWVPMHELGHQFGANHTFGGVLGRCTGNINTTTSWEPGGGSTIMAYPGACPVGGPYGDGTNDNLVQFGDNYFNAGSILEMRSFLATPASGCSVSVPTSNPDAPAIATITATNVVVPPSTPFALALTATDSTQATLTYTWEQQDAGVPQTLVPPANADNGDSALFRSWPPAGVPRRNFPRLSDLLAGTSYIGERMPTFTGVTRTFRAVIRDNQGAATVSDQINVAIAPSAPFRYLAPTCSIIRGEPNLIQWDPGSTAATPFNATQVRILLSTNDGATFPTVLATVNNTGSWTFTPSLSVPLTPNARIRIEPVSGIYFTISPKLNIALRCDSIDFNRDAITPDSADLDDYLAVLAGGPTACSNFPNCGDLDFNNDCLTPDSADLDAFVIRLAGGPCP